MISNVWAVNVRRFVCNAILAGVIAVPCSAQRAIDRVVQTADRFLGTLDEAQRSKVVYSFSDDAQRARWSNFPTGVVPRGGISFKQMTAVQKAAAVELLKTVLSSRGYEKVNEIRAADDNFKANGSKRGQRGGGGGPRPGGPGGPPTGGGPPNAQGAGGHPPFGGGDLFGSDLYYISFLGKPSTTAPWMLQFGGHHLALNLTIIGSRGIMTPSLTGAQPAVFTLDGKTIRPLGRESDEALVLLQSLDATQRSQAVLKYQVPDLVLGPGQDGKKITPEGLKVSSMTEKQKSLLLQVIAEWAGIVNDDMAAARMAQIKSELNDTWFAWSGATDLKAAATSQRITGFKDLIW